MLSYRTPAEFGQRFSGPTELRGDRARLRRAGLPRGARRAVRRELVADRVPPVVRVDRPARDRPRRGPGTDTLAAVEGDWLVPPADVERLAAGLGAPSTVHLIDSTYGHDAFLKETEQVAAVPPRRARGAARGRCRHDHARHAGPAPGDGRRPGRHRHATPRTARSFPARCCRARSASPRSARSGRTTTRAAATRPATCSARPSPSSRAAPAASSPRPGWARSRSCCRCSSPVIVSSSRTTATAGAGDSSTRWRRSTTSSLVTADLTDPAQVAAAVACEPGDGLDRDAEQPAAADHRHRGRGRGRARGRRARASSTTRSCRRPSSSRSRSAPTSSCTRRRSTSTATATSSAVRWSPSDAGAARAVHLVGQRARPDRQPVRQLSHAARSAHARRPAAGAPGERRGDRARLGRPPGGRRRALARAARPPRPRARRAPAAGVRRDAERRPGRRRSRRPRRSSMGCATSRSPSRSAASRAWSRTRRR